MTEYDAAVSLAPHDAGAPPAPARVASSADTIYQVVDPGPVAAATDPAPSSAQEAVPETPAPSPDTRASTKPRRLIIYEALSGRWALGLGLSMEDKWNSLLATYDNLLKAAGYEVPNATRLVLYATKKQILAALLQSQKGDIFVFHGHGAPSRSLGTVLLGYRIRPATWSRDPEIEITAKDIIGAVKWADGLPTVLMLSGCQTRGLLPELANKSGIPVVWGTTEDIDAGDATRAVAFLSALLVENATIEAAQTAANGYYSTAEFQALTSDDKNRSKRLYELDGLNRFMEAKP